MLLKVLNLKDEKLHHLTQLIFIEIQNSNIQL